MKNMYLNSSHDIETINGQLYVTNTYTQWLSQKIENRLKTFKGEFFANINIGIPYYESILKKQIGNIETVNGIFRSEILKIADVVRIVSFTTNYENSTRTYRIDYVVQGKGETINGSLSI